MTFIFILLFLALLFVFLPIRVGAEARYGKGGAAAAGRVRPWYGLCGLQVSYGEGGARVAPLVLRWAPWAFRVPARRKVPAPEAEKPEEKIEEAAEGLAEKISRLREMWASFRRFEPAVLRFLKRAGRGFGFRCFECRVVLGTGNPATTGCIYGYTLAVSSLMGRRMRVQMVPDYHRARLEGEGTLEVSVFLYRLLWAVACLAVRLGWTWAVGAWGKWRRKPAAVRLRAVR